MDKSDFACYSPETLTRCLDVLSSHDTLPGPLRNIQRSIQAALNEKTGLKPEPLAPLENVVIVSTTSEELERQRPNSKPRELPYIPESPKPLTREDRIKARLAGANLRNVLDKVLK